MIIKSKKKVIIIKLFIYLNFLFYKNVLIVQLLNICFTFKLLCHDRTMLMIET